jgi:hypothetical protein
MPTLNWIIFGGFILILWGMSKAERGIHERLDNIEESLNALKKHAGITDNSNWPDY